MSKIFKIIIKVLMPVMSKVTPACDVITKKISESMDHSIPVSDRLRIRIHLLGCVFCKRFLEQLEVMRKIIERQIPEMNEPSAGPELPEEVRQKMKEKIKQNIKS